MYAFGDATSFGLDDETGYGRGCAPCAGSVDGTGSYDGREPLASEALYAYGWEDFWR